MIRRPPSSPLFPSTTLFRSSLVERGLAEGALGIGFGIAYTPGASREEILRVFRVAARHGVPCFVHLREGGRDPADPKSTRLNSSHSQISYGRFCLYKKNLQS